MLSAVVVPGQALLGGLRGAVLGTTDLLERRNGRREVLRLRRGGRGGRKTTVLTSDGVGLHVETDGPQDADVTVVFVHGFSLDLTNFRFQRAALQASGLRLVHYDQRGFGRSPQGSAGASMRLLAADLAAVIAAEASGSVVLVGHSMGVMVVTALAGLHPELFGDQVAGTVLVAGNAGGLRTSEFGLGPALGPALQLVGLGGMQALGSVPGVERTATFGLYMGIAGMFMCDETASHETLRICASLISQNKVAQLGAWGQAMYEHDEVASLPVLGRVPCTVLAADHDRFIPAALTQELADGIPGAELVVVEHSGHMIPVEHPERVTAAVNDLVRRARA